MEPTCGSHSRVHLCQADLVQAAGKDVQAVPSHAQARSQALIECQAALEQLHVVLGKVLHTHCFCTLLQRCIPVVVALQKDCAQMSVLWAHAAPHIMRSAERAL